MAFFAMKSMNISECRAHFFDTQCKGHQGLNFYNCSSKPTPLVYNTICCIKCKCLQDSNTSLETKTPILHLLNWPSQPFLPLEKGLLESSWTFFTHVSFVHIIYQLLPSDLPIGSLNPWKGHLKRPKRVTLNQVYIYINTCNGSWKSLRCLR